VPPKRELLLQKEGMLRMRLLNTIGQMRLLNTIGQMRSLNTTGQMKSLNTIGQMRLLNTTDQKLKVRLLDTSTTNIISEQAWLDI